jgi:cyclopropane fatty-acyl-phospholipid synthase-like methyltransferase
MADPEVLERMRADWNGRAQEDANYYVAFGRHDQDDEEFFASAADVVRALEQELKRLGPDPAPPSRRALEIGCGPGRLMRPMSRHFEEIHGVDVSNEMIRLASQKLSGIPFAHVHHTQGSDLAPLASDYFDFVYSYAVFQHIPSKEVVFQYLSEARRVLKPGGILCCQINGLPDTAQRYTTWDGVRISEREVRDFTREHDFQLLRLEGSGTQYMWTTWRKQLTGWFDGAQRMPAVAQPPRIRGLGNSQTGEPAVPSNGRFACVSLWIDGLPSDADLNMLEATVDGAAGSGCYIGPPMWDGLTQFNVILPEQVRTGLVPIDVCWAGKPLCATAWIRVIPPGPSAPHVCSVMDGINLLSGARIETGAVKMILEDVDHVDTFSISVDGLPVRDPEWFCINPRTHHFEVNFRLPEGLGPGAHQIRIKQGSRHFPPIPIAVG